MTIRIDFRKSEDKKPLKLLWATDLHLDAADKIRLHSFYSYIEENKPDAILIGGDISNGVQSAFHLKTMAERLKKTIYFVLGNHDFYYGSIYKTREKIESLIKESPNLVYLTHSNIIELAPTTALVGHDGWYDGKAGDFLKSDVALNDYLLIDELKDLSPEDRLNKLTELGNEAGKFLKGALDEALKRYDQVIVLTHVPPFPESCMHEGAMCDANWAPHFVSQTTGEGLLQVALQYPEKKVVVLCGHTHALADVAILPNLRVITGPSELGVPKVQSVILVS